MITRDEFLGRNRPDLLAAREAIRSATAPVVRALGEYASLDGAVYFARDNYYDQTASTVEVVNRNTKNLGRFAFQQGNISGRRVDLLSTTVGETFSNGIEQFAQSRMNPDEHVVYGVPVGEDEANGVLQFAFNERYGQLPNDREVRRTLASHRTSLAAAATTYAKVGTQYDSMSDALLLDTPTTPNAYIVEWDLDGSTRSRHSSYPMLRDYLNQATTSYQDIFASAGGMRMKANGDGETYHIGLPHPEIDRNNLAQVGQFGNTVIKSVIAEIMMRHTELAADYDGIIGPLRVIAELGHFEPTKMGESSPSMWDLSEVAKQAERGRSVALYGSRALEAFAAAG